MRFSGIIAKPRKWEQGTLPIILREEFNESVYYEKAFYGWGGFCFLRGGPGVFRGNWSLGRGFIFEDFWHPHALTPIPPENSCSRLNFPQI